MATLLRQPRSCHRVPGQHSSGNQSQHFLLCAWIVSFEIVLCVAQVMYLLVILESALLCLR